MNETQAALPASSRRPETVDRLVPEAADAIEDYLRFVTLEPGAPDDADYAAVLAVAHQAFDAQRYGDAERLYEFLHRRKQGGYICQLRYADLLLKRADTASALEILKSLERHPDRDYWADFLQGYALASTYHFADARVYMEKAVRAQPTNDMFWRAIFGVMAALGLPLEVDDFSMETSPERRLELLIISRIRALDLAELSSLHAKLSSESQESVDSFIVEEIGRLTQNADRSYVEEITAIIESTAAVERGTIPVICAAISSYLSKMAWAAADALIKRAEDRPAVANDPNFRARKLEYFCYTLQYDKALNFWGEEAESGDIPVDAACTLAELLGMYARWTEILSLARKRVRAGHSIAAERLLAMLCNAVRNTGRYAEVLAVLRQAMSIQGASPPLQSAYDGLLLEARLLLRLGRNVPLERQEVEARPGSALHCGRETLLNALIDCTKPAQARATVFLCSDSAYLIGSCVAVNSLVRNNIVCAGNYELRVYVSDEDLAIAMAVFQRIAAVFGADISVLPASALLERTLELRTDWGFFAGRLGLSAAAYLRIFAARQLLREGIVGRALYLDSDATVSGDLNELLGWDLRDQLLGARREEPRSHIHLAADKLGIAREEYFNSGVLLFDLLHPELSSALDRAIDVALHEAELLTFHDQCALNLAFAKRVAYLPDRFNYFVRPCEDLPAAISEPVIRHFLDRPKPWDPIYATANCGPWLRELSSLGRLLGPALMKQLLGRQYPDINLQRG
jgi:lipopolysaccharide biosynthesis glycosyltransferase